MVSREKKKQKREKLTILKEKTVDLLEDEEGRMKRNLWRRKKIC